MALTLPPPPKTRSIWGLLATLLFVGWTGYLLATQQDKKNEKQAPAQVPVPVAVPDPGYVEIDLRGPQYDAGRFAGFEKGREARKSGMTAPASSVLAFQANAAAGTEKVAETEKEDFTAGYASGFLQAMAEQTEK